MTFLSRRKQLVFRVRVASEILFKKRVPVEVNSVKLGLVVGDKSAELLELGKCKPVVGEFEGVDCAEGKNVKQDFKGVFVQPVFVKGNSF